MKTVVALMVAALLAVVANGGTREVSHLETGASSVAELLAQHRSNVQPAPSASDKPAGITIDEPVRVAQGRRVVHIPTRCRDAQGRYDVVVHFHGATTTIEPIWERADIDAVFVIINLGIGSGPYENAFSHDGSLAQLMESIDKLMQKHCPAEGGSRHRLALSAWSAGYGAIYRALNNKNDSELIDAVLLADGLHAGFKDKARRLINAPQMEGFDRFAAKAVTGDKLFAITHSAIKTPYASTTETAGYLVAQRGLTRQKVRESGPRPSMYRTSRVEKGSFSVEGYEGNDTHAHCDHLYAIGDTLFPLLRSRWGH